MATSLSSKQYKLPTYLDEWSQVSVIWEDAVTVSGPCVAADVLASLQPCIRRASGYVLQYNDSRIVIAGMDDREAGTPGDAEDITVIPIAYIRRIIKK